MIARLRFSLFYLNTSKEIFINWHESLYLMLKKMNTRPIIIHQLLSNFYTVCSLKYSYSIKILYLMVIKMKNSRPKIIIFFEIVYSLFVEIFIINKIVQNYWKFNDEIENFRYWPTSLQCLFISFPSHSHHVCSLGL